MANLFGNIIRKILSRTIQKNNEIYRNISITTKSKENLSLQSSCIILKATKDDYDSVIKLMREAYYREEPTYASLKITRNSILDEIVKMAMAEGHSLVARCKYDGCICGVALNQSTYPWDPDIKEKWAASVGCPKVKQLLLFNAHLQQLPDLWRSFSVKKVLEMNHLFVKQEHRRKGIALKLLQESRLLARDKGYKVFRCDATNVHIADLCEKLNMQKVAEIPYHAYLGQNLEPVFQPPHPHEAVKVYIDAMLPTNKTENNKELTKVQKYV